VKNCTKSCQSTDYQIKILSFKLKTLQSKTKTDQCTIWLVPKMKTNGERLMLLDEVEQLDDDWHLIDTICAEAKKCQQLLEKPMHNKPVSKKKLCKSLNLIKKNHQKIMLSFYLRAKILRFSPKASKQMEKTLKALNDDVRVATLNLKRWETDSAITVNHLRHDFVYLAYSYNEFGVETKMFKDLVKNTARLMA